MEPLTPQQVGLLGENVDASSLYDLSLSTLSSAGYIFEQHREHLYFSAPFGGKPVRYTATVICGSGFLTVLAELPLTIHADRRSEALARLNEMSVEVPFGSYQLAGGEIVQFKIGIPVRNSIEPAIILAMFSVATEFIGRVIQPALGWIAAPSSEGA